MGTEERASGPRSIHGPALLLGIGVVAVAVLLGVLAARGLMAKRAPTTVLPVPVVLATAEQRDVPITATGIGTVQASNTVTVKVRVDGEIQRVTFVEGQNVHAGDLLAQIDPRPYQALLEQALANRARDAATLASARRDLDRAVNLVEHGFVSRQSLDSLRTAVDAAEAAVQGDEAQIRSARLQLTYTTVVAPIAGRTGIRLIDQGNLVHAADNGGLVVITQLEPITVVFTLPEETLDAVTDAMHGHEPLRVLAFGHEDPERPRAEGSLIVFNNQIDATTGTIQLKASFPNADHRLWPGQFVTVRLLLDTRRGAVTVPAAAVQNGPAGTFAYVVKPDQTVEMRALRIAQVRDAVALVASGLAAGERVVTEGQFNLKPGATIAERRASVTATAGSASP